MASTHLIPQLLLITALLVLTQADKQCTQENVDICFLPMKEFEYELDAAIVPTMDEATLKDHCRRYDLAETCMEDVRPQCSQTDQLIFEGIEDAYQFLCHDGIDEYLEYRDCFTNRDLQREGQTCNNTFSNSLESLANGNYDADYKRDRICQYVKQYLDCVDNIVESFCGADAAKWQRTLDTYSLAPLLDGIGCSLYGNYAKVHWVAITIGVLLTLSIIIIICSVILIIKQKRKRRPRISEQVPPVADAPPPYVVYSTNGQQSNHANMAQAQTAGPLPTKNNVDMMNPPPYEPLQHQHAVAPPVYDSTATPAGYFGAASGETAQAQAQTKATDEKDTAPEYNGGFSNPTYTGDA